MPPFRGGVRRWGVQNWAGPEGGNLRKSRSFLLVSRFSPHGFLPCLRAFPSYAARSRKGCRGWFLAVLVGLSLSAGCSFIDSLRGNGFHDEESDTLRAARGDSDVRVSGFSNKARDIERDLGASD